MNCHEFKSYFENISLTSADTRSEPSLAEHISECPKCSQFIEGQKELRTSLALLRESVCSPPSTLDEVVLANYRKQVAGRGAASEAARVRKLGSRASLRWTFGFAAAMVLVTILLWPRTQPGETIRALTVPPVISSVRLNAAAQGTPNPPKAGGEKRRNDALKRTHATVSTAATSSPVPEGFRSLMYCDELSCGGAMDVVRIELQPSDAGLIAVAPQGRNVISADVLVGADGIARGIRIVR